ncbi:penicillin acylase family protein [Streptosporangium roseum]|uniref:Protein related to penicillin acylase-like protein n=1 Tax=Streptosporangium roseum (strain ATCC 12428 / DSM 43021 / JCM 3005 / KCTC 9067 / NCIMB 10171 / NRRL 2505 / NI 9100) TaxID=479432 RepID=D2B5Q6_STRRD|nr:penicillin acylase family protein [Streptosporangium roseum]ACZ91360.1 Protein related to penicillin acylase-like protein [Streptosporangium roseum DSM 43021]
MHARLRRKITAASALAILTLASLVVPASAATFTTDDYCLGECADILPPGQNGNATLVEILANQSLGTMPRHSDDQLGKYANLLSGYTGLTDDQITTFFNDSSFGVPAGQVQSTTSPRPDVTIVRDKATGVPHITGTTREGTMFGAGYAGAQDRLWVMDLMRHVGRGELTPFAGGAPGNRALEQSVWRNSPYTEADFQAQINRLRTSGTRGAQLYADVQNYVSGVNAYIDRCMANRNCPGEYVLTGHLDAVTNAGGPEDFTMTDLIAVSGVVGGLFGGGGGAEMQSALVRVAARARYGTAAGDQVWAAFRAQNDPEATLTLHNGQSFPSGNATGATGTVLPDPATAPVDITENETGSATTSASPSRGLLDGLIVDNSKPGMSNAVVVSAAKSASGHPIAVFGPQTGYFAPQLLMLEELSGPGIRARGAAFAGLNLYVLLGRGTDYAWSATSSGQDITDTYALQLCEPGGGTVTTASNHYLYRGTCTAMETLKKTNAWKPTTADSTAAGSYDLVMKRTKYGLVSWRGTVNGQPTAFATLRSTYQHEADSAIGFQMFNEPAQMGDAAAFAASASKIGFAFNWFYVNSSDAAYFMSGNTPVRSAVSDPNLPMTADAAHEWAGFDPATNTATYTAPAAHPQTADQDYLVSWNNKQAKDYGAADGNFSFGPVHRADLLDAPVKAALAGSGKLDRAGTVKIMAEAATTDLRGRKVLPDLLRVINSATVTDPALASAVSKLSAWASSGARRLEASPGGKAYAHADAIRVFDAWWPKLVQAAFKPSLGDGLYQSLVNALQINESPSGHQQGDVSNLPTSANEAQTHKGSAFQYGWWGYVSKDVRAVLGDPVSGPLPGRHCGGGTPAGCRTVLLNSLSAALAEPATTTYPADGVCAAGDQWCADAVQQSPLGGIKQSLISWQNRPTYQQVVSFPAHRGDSVTNLAGGKKASASSVQSFLYPAGKAVDGDPTTRWSSAAGDDQYLQVDLGSAMTVARTVLRWESAYGTGYSIQTSSDGSTWTTVHSTTTGNGGVDNVTFSPTTARYVRMRGVTRATSYGYSLYELEVYSR